MLQTRFLKILLLIQLILFAISCSTRISKRSARQTTETSITAVVSGLTDDETIQNKYRYELSCEALSQPLVGQRILSDINSTLRFSSETTLEGETCSLRIWGAIDASISWLSSPKTEGLYYGSETGTVNDGKLELNLFKVYRVATPPSQGLVAVATADLGVCESFDVELSKCTSSTPDPEPTPDPIPAPTTEPTPDPTPVVAEVSYTDWLGLTEFHDSNERPQIKTISTGSWADKSALEIGDTITLVDTTVITNLSILNEVLQNIKADVDRTSDLVINVLRGNSNEIILLTSKNRPSPKVEDFQSNQKFQ